MPRDPADVRTALESELLSDVSHELRNPLSAIMASAGSMTRLDEHHQLDAEHIENHAQLVRRNAERMTRLIDDVVDLADIAAGRFHLVRAEHAPDAIVRAAIDALVAQSTPRGPRFEPILDAPLPFLACDRDRIVQAITRVVAHVVEADGADGTVMVSARFDGSEIAFVVRHRGRLAATAHDDASANADDGPDRAGITRATTSISLRIATGIVEAHGGRITDDSVPGDGTTVSLAVPGVILD